MQCMPSYICSARYIIARGHYWSLTLKAFMRVSSYFMVRGRRSKEFSSLCCWMRFITCGIES
jgi:hypothetical protein